MCLRSELRIALQEVASCGIQARATALLPAAGALDQGLAQHPFGIVQVRERMAIRPPDSPGRRPYGAGHVNRAEEIGPAVADGEAPAGVEPDLVMDREPIFSLVHLGPGQVSRERKSRQEGRLTLGATPAIVLRTFRTPTKERRLIFLGGFSS